jgi:two-component system, OmpR family, response regulator
LQVDGEPMVMAGRELSLIEALLMRGRRVVTRDHLHGAVYGTEVDIASNALDALVSRLRKRLTDCNAGVEIVAVRGVGYMMTDA